VVWVPKIRRLFLFNYVCGLFIDVIVLFSRGSVTRGLWGVIVQKSVDLIVTASIGRW